MKIANIPTKFNDINYRSRLEAKWAAVFYLYEIDFEYEPIDLDGWIPDFIIKEYCWHSECEGGHTLICEVKPYLEKEKFNNHRITSMENIGGNFDGYLALGATPEAGKYFCVHGAGGAWGDTREYFENFRTSEQKTDKYYRSLIPLRHIWNEATNMVQWKGKALT